MSSTWTKHGRILEAGGGPCAVSHAMLPTPLLLEDRIRLFFASCDTGLRGRVFCADLRREPPFEVFARPPQPILDLGPPGRFDCDGINPSCLVKVGGQLRLYTIGWRRGAPR